MNNPHRLKDVVNKDSCCHSGTYIRHVFGMWIDCVFYRCDLFLFSRYFPTALHFAEFEWCLLYLSLLWPFIPFLCTCTSCLGMWLSVSTQSMQSRASRFISLLLLYPSPIHNPTVILHCVLHKVWNASPGIHLTWVEITFLVLSPIILQRMPYISTILSLFFSLSLSSLNTVWATLTCPCTPFPCIPVVPIIQERTQIPVPLQSFLWPLHLVGIIHAFNS